MGIASFLQRAKRFLLGAPRDLFDPKLFHRISLIAFFAWVGLGADGISSSAYGPEEAFLALGEHTSLAIFIAIATVITVFIISGSYARIIEKFPMGGGGYILAAKLLGQKAGVVSGSALVIDYVLTVTISVAAGVDAVFSFLPLGWQAYKFSTIALVIMVLIVLNLRGIKESVAVLTPIFLAFIICHVPLVLYAVLLRGRHRVGGHVRRRGRVGVLRSVFCHPAGLLDGGRNVHGNRGGLQRHGDASGTPRENGKEGALVGIILGYMLNGVQHVAGKTLNASLIEGVIGTLWEGQTKSVIVAFVLVTEATLLFVAAQTGFLGGPQVLSSMAVDSYMPHRFAHLSDRLVTKYGVYFMGMMAIVMLFLTGGSVKYLVIMYSINVFLTFTVDQFGMCVHWLRERKTAQDWKFGLGMNGVGFLLTASILIATVLIKFPEGGWLTLLITGTFIAISFLIRRHYRSVEGYMRRLDELLTGLPPVTVPSEQEPVPRKDSPTAAIMVSGYNGMGMHVFFSVIRSFPGMFRNFVFLSAGVIDSSTFKGVEEIENLGADLEMQLQKYVEFAKGHGYYAEARSEVGTDVITVIDHLAPELANEYPNITFFAGQLVFEEESFINRVLHNQTAFLTQRKLVFHGLPMIIMPVRVL
jgi:amino acid transporter